MDFTGYVYRVSFRRHRAVEVDVKLLSRRKRVFGSPICRGVHTAIPQISDMRFQIAVTSEPVLVEFR